MRRSPNRHVLAILREEIGLTQKELALITDYKAPTIQAVELGKLKMSPKMARVISENTGVNVGWLLDGDLSTPITDLFNEPYSKETYERIRSLRDNPDYSELPHMGMVAMLVSVLFVRISKMIVESAEKDEFHLVKWKIESALSEIIKDVGLTKNITATERHLIYEIIGVPDGGKDFEGELKFTPVFNLDPLEDHVWKEFRKLQKSSKSKRPSRKRSVKSQTKP